MEAYMLRWMFGEDVQGLADFENRSRAEIAKGMRAWGDFFTLARGHIQAFEHQHLHGVAPAGVHGSGLREAWNPLRPLFSFADAQAVVSSISTQFGRYWETECEGLMQILLKSERRGTGRVPLSRFYAAALGGQWHFTESAAYLRQLGVLDDSSSFHGPQLIASNYMQSSNNCVVTHKHFRVCCANPCQDFYSDLEAAIGAPEGEPEEILAIVSNFSSGLEDAAAGVTKKLRAQLQEIAEAHHGKIPLHGRLFAQWLHFVFPTECPFPHKSGSVSGLSPKEFGNDRSIATIAEMKEAVRQGKTRTNVNRSKVEDEEDSESDDFMDAWSHEEELLSPHLWQRPRSTRSVRGTLRLVLYALATLSVFVLGVLKPAMQAIGVASEHGYSSGWLGCWQKKEASPWETKAHFV